MRLLQIISSLSIGGAEKLLVDSLPIYIKKGVCVDLLVVKNEHSSPFYDMICKNKDVGVLVLTRRWLYNPFLVFKLIPHIKRYDVIHTHLFPAIYLVAFASCLIKKNKTKFILTEHSTHNKRRNYSFLKPIERFIYNRYNTIISISSETNQRLINWLSFDKSSKPEFKIVENGILVDEFISAKPYKKTDLAGGISNNDVLLCMVGRFSRQKDQQTIVESLTLLSDKIKLIFVGDGEVKQDVEDFVLKKRLTNRVVFLGSRTDIPQILKTVDICILSSHWEGFGLSAVESMASKKPTIASNVPGLAEVVAGAGLLFDKGDYVQLSGIINNLVSDRLFYEDIASRCLTRAKDYDIEYMIEKQISIYTKY